MAGRVPAAPSGWGIGCAGGDGTVEPGDVEVPEELDEADVDVDAVATSMILSLKDDRFAVICGIEVVVES